MFRSLALVLLFAFAALSLPHQARAADEVFATAEGAIRGYDPVAYQLQSRPVRGLRAITHRWKGADWHFANAANRDLFAADPERYAPRFGGYCAFGTAQGYKVSSDPQAFAVVGGRLYLNNSRRVQLLWDLDRPGYIAKASANWTTLEAAPYTNDE
jgi:hypothetical protein